MAPGPLDNKGEGEWQSGICGCFADCSLCIITYIAPCYTVGKNAEVFGESCMMMACLFLIGFNFEPIMRWRIRNHKGIAGSMCSDVLYTMFCPLCSIVQQANELGWRGKAAEGESMARE